MGGGGDTRERGGGLPPLYYKYKMNKINTINGKIGGNLPNVWGT